MVPLGIAGGVYAALHVGSWRDRAITLTGLSLTIVPEFVSSIVLILVLRRCGSAGCRSRRHGGRAAVRSCSCSTCILPAMPLVIVLFGYIARMARAGTVRRWRPTTPAPRSSRASPRGVVIRRHVLRNALLPTITVIATQTGYLIGGLVVVETLFRYRGIGSLILTAARGKDFPMLEAGILTVGAIYIAATLIADAVTLLLDPRLQLADAR